MKARFGMFVLLAGASLTAQAATFADEGRNLTSRSFAAESDVGTLSLGRNISAYRCENACDGSAGTQSALPEPGSRAGLLAGLGLMAAIARRRRSVG